MKKVFLAVLLFGSTSMAAPVKVIIWDGATTLSAAEALLEKHSEAMSGLKSVFRFNDGYPKLLETANVKGLKPDMLGDAIVYGFSLYVLYRSDRWKAKAAFLKGILIVGFAAYVLVDTTLKAVNYTVPTASTMGIVGALALFANATCLVLLLRHRHDDINMKSTFICSRNDIISNAGVLIAAGLVYLTESKWPDILIGYTIAVLFFKSAWPILRESIHQLRTVEAEVS